MRLLYFGMDGAFSYPPLRAILRVIEAGRNKSLEVAAVLMPVFAAPHVQFDGPVSLLPPERPHSELPLIQPYLAENIIHLSWANDIPVYLVQDMGDPAVQAHIRTFRPDIACVACFPYLIPKEILSLPKNGFLNIHPSLLPEYRGPEPLFWIFRNGDQENAGVTLHWMDEGLDTGDILSQRSLTLPDGISGSEADRLCATIGGEMLIEGLELIAAGQAPRWPQPPDGSYQSQPAVEAFILDRNWSARRAYNFMRGTAEWNHPYTLQVDSRTLVLKTAESFYSTQTLPQPIQEKDGRYLIQFSPGTLLAR